MRVLSALLNPFFSHDAHGGLPTLFAATSPEAVSGGYYAPKRFQELTGDTAPAEIPGVAKKIRSLQNGRGPRPSSLQVLVSP